MKRIIYPWNDLLLIYYLHLLRVCMTNTTSVVHDIFSWKSSYFAVHDAILWLQWSYKRIITIQTRGLIVVWVLFLLSKVKGRDGMQLICPLLSGKYLLRLSLSVHMRQLFVATATAPAFAVRENEMVRRGYIKAKYLPSWPRMCQ